ncbi:MAG TPA: DUF5694 domain-containing protein [Flavobacteriales bacterium]|nr:DUF5694 domain-containing protein [Flavobacteriales bacterium]
MTIRGLLACSFTLFALALISQDGARFDPDAILVGDRPQAHVLLVGTFHFGYPGLDAHKTAESDQVDVLSPQRQKEMAELAGVIMRFRPNKIAMETQGGWLMSEYRTHKAERTSLGRNEYYQIGFRIMDMAGIDTLYAVDADPLMNDLYEGPDSLLHRPWLDSLYAGWDWGGEDAISQRYTELYKQQDLFERDHTLLESFLALNDDHALDRGFGAYLHGGFELSDHRGADILSLHWYDRNLRIFRNIQEITTSPDDRILVLFGAGHMGILKHLFECSPQYALVRLSELVEQ